MKHSMKKKAEDNPSCDPRTSGLGEMSVTEESLEGSMAHGG